MELTELTRHLIITLAPLIASGALAKVGEDTTDATKNLVQRTWALLQQHVQGNRKAEAALTLYEDDPYDPSLQQRVQQYLIACLQKQHDALDELTELLEQLQTAQAGSPSIHTREITTHDQSQVGTVVQGDVQGNLTIGDTTFGDTVQGDKISGDITIRNVSGSGITIGHGSQNQTRQDEREGTASPRTPCA
jgi:hypothetical protein